MLFVDDGGGSLSGHPAGIKLLAAVAAMWALAADAAGPPPPPMYPMILHPAFVDPTAGYDQWSMPPDAREEAISHAIRMLLTNVLRLQRRGLAVIKQEVQRRDSSSWRGHALGGSGPTRRTARRRV